LDGSVNGLDINTVASHWLSKGSNGDANGDGIVNGLDINLIATNWLSTINTTSNPVPEPSTAILIASSLILVLQLKRRFLCLV